MGAIISIDSICLQHKCSACCNPVKIDSRIIIDKSLPFVDLGCILIPKNHPDTIRLKTYRCEFYNPETGLCRDYANRPDICRNTFCMGFVVAETERIMVISAIKNEEFFSIPIKNAR